MTKRFRPLLVAVCVTGLALIAPAVASAATATHFIFSVPSPVTPGQAFSFTVTAVDNNGAVDTTYTGPVTFSTNDPAGTVPAGPQPLTMGTGTFSATLRTPGCRRITASGASIASSSQMIAVGACDVVDVQSGAITAQDPTETARVAPAPTPGQCGTTLGATTVAGSAHYDAYGHVNLANNPICVTVDVTPNAADCDDGAIADASYLGAFDPSNPTTNYVSGGGASGHIGVVTSHSYTVPAGSSFADVIYATTVGGTCSSYFYELSANRPFPLTLPEATGTPAVGNVLGFQTGTWVDNPSFSYQWLRCDAAGANCAAIAGATSGTYEVTSVDGGHALRIRVAGTDPLGTSTADSPPTSVVPTVVAAGVTATSTGQRAAALKKCKKIKDRKKRKRCVKRAKRLPV
jgi:hypothetical protein